MRLLRSILNWFTPVPAPAVKQRPLPDFMVRHFEAQERGDFNPTITRRLP